MLKQMDLELTTNSNLEKNQANVFLSYKKKYEDSKSKYFIIKENYTYTKKMDEMILTTEMQHVDETKSEMANQTLLEQEKLLYVSSDKLQRVRRSAMEIENISKNIMVDLEGQTQQMNSTKNKISIINSTIDSSTSLINKIMNREHRNKAIVGLFSLTLVALFVMILYTRA